MTGWINVGNFEKILVGTRLTLDVTPSQSDGLRGTISGSGGCNRYFGSYEIDGNRIKIMNIGSTKMYCDQPAGLMEQESRYLNSLLTASRFEITGDQLEIGLDDGRRLVLTEAMP